MLTGEIERNISISPVREMFSLLRACKTLGLCKYFVLRFVLRSTSVFDSYGSSLELVVCFLGKLCHLFPTLAHDFVAALFVGFSLFLYLAGNLCRGLLFPANLPPNGRAGGSRVMGGLWAKWTIASCYIFGRSLFSLFRTIKIFKTFSLIHAIVYIRLRRLTRKGILVVLRAKVNALYFCVFCSFIFEQRFPPCMPNFDLPDGHFYSTTCLRVKYYRVNFIRSHHQRMGIAYWLQPC